MSYRTYLASNKFISLPFAKFSVGEIASSISDEQTGLTRCLKSNADEMGKKAVTWQQSKSARSNNVAAWYRFEAIKMPFATTLLLVPLPLRVRIAVAVDGGKKVDTGSKTDKTVA